MFYKNNQGMKQTQEKFEETKRIIISRKSKDRQYNGQLRLDVIVHFVDIVGIVSHHCLNYLFIKSFPFKF
jgi:hypothetical protein